MVQSWIGTGAELAGAGMGTALGAGLLACAFIVQFVQVLAGSWTTAETYRLS